MLTINSVKKLLFIKKNGRMIKRSLVGADRSFPRSLAAKSVFRHLPLIFTLMNVYDFDGTIYDGESSIEFIFFFIRKDPGILRHLPIVLKACNLYRKGLLSVESFTGDYRHILSDFCMNNKIDMNAAVNEFWDKHYKKINSFYPLQQKDDDVIITASPSFMMDEVARRLGVRNLICTDLDLKTGEIRKACFRERKVPMFFDVYPGASIDNFYTDSMNDEFLFPYSKNVFLVKNGKVTQYFSDAVGSKL